jgi:hypothetical protein
MKRWLFNIVCLLILLLWLLTIGLWGRTYFVADQFLVHRFENVPEGTYWTYYVIDSAMDGIGFNRVKQALPWDGARAEAHVRRNWAQFHITKPAPHRNFNFGPSKRYCGIQVCHIAYYDHSPIPNGPRMIGHHVVVPFWELLLAITLVGSPFWLYWYRTRSRYKRGHCPHCGYDLRASGDICPECGQARTSSLQASSPSAAR